MTQVQEPAPEQQPEAHSHWRYTGQTDGTVMLHGVPIANVTEGETLAAEDEVQAEKLARSGHFEQVDGPEVKLPTPQPVVEPEALNVPQPELQQPATPEPSQPAPGGTE